MDGVHILAGGQISLRQVAKSFEQVGIQCDGAFKLNNGLARLALRHEDGAKTALRFGMIGMECENMPILPFRFGKGARLMRANGGVKDAGEIIRVPDGRRARRRCA